MAASLFKWFIACVFLTEINSGHNHSGFEGVNVHPLYVSVTEINHNAKDRTLEISCKIFTNDFETTLEKYFTSKVDLTDPKNDKTAGKWITEYVEKHLHLKVDGKTVQLQYLGSEKETDATWSYFQVSDVPAVKKLEIMNNLLYESFESEINIMHVSVNGQRKSTKLTNPELNTSFEF